MTACPIPAPRPANPAAAPEGGTTYPCSHSLGREIVSIYLGSLTYARKSPFSKSVSVFSKVADITQFIVIVAPAVVGNEVPNVNTIIAASLQSDILAIQASDQIIIAFFDDHQVLVQVAQAGVERNDLVIVITNSATTASMTTATAISSTADSTFNTAIADIEACVAQVTIIIVKVEDVAVRITNDGSYWVVIDNHSVEPVVVGNGVGVMNESTRVHRNESFARMNFFRIWISYGVDDFVGTGLGMIDKRHGFDKGSEILILDLGRITRVNPFLSDRPCNAGSTGKGNGDRFLGAKRRDPKRFHLLRPLRHP